jgi:hypothetical protein
MTAFAALSLISAAVVLLLRESPMIITERDRLAMSSMNEGD